MSDGYSTPIDPYRNQLTKYHPFSELEKKDYDLYAYYRDVSKEQNAGDYTGMACYFEDWMRYYYMMDLVDKGVRLIPFITSFSLDSCSEQTKVYILGLSQEILSKVYDDRDYSVYNDEMIERIFKACESFFDETVEKWRKEDEEDDIRRGIRRR